MPDTLASVCNNIGFRSQDGSTNIVCQGFVYDHQQNVVFFKGQANGQLLDTTRTCSNPTTFAWLRKTGEQQASAFSWLTDHQINIHRPFKCCMV